MSTNLFLKEIVCVFTILLFCKGLFAEPVQSDATLTPACQKFIDGLGSEYRHGWVKVPEDYNNPNGSKISVFWFTKMKPGQIPVAFHHGGPQATDRYSYSAFSGLENRYGLGFIYIDQRGNGCSSAYPKMTSADEVKRLGLYGSESIARDSELVRIAVLGENTKWKMFGQSYGGYITERYLTLFPQNLIEVYNYAGYMTETEAETLYLMVKSQYDVIKTFYSAFPNSEKNLSVISKLMTEDKCAVANPKTNVQVCGKALLAFLGRDYLGSPDQWTNFSKLVSDPVHCAATKCLFKDDLSLNDEYFNEFFKDREFLVAAFWGEFGSLPLHALFGQDLKHINLRNPSYRDECDRAEKIAAQKGVDLKNMYINECNLLRSTTGQVPQSKVKELFAKIEAKNTFSFSKLKAVLLAHPQIQYTVFAGDLDFLGSQFDLANRFKGVKNVKLIRYADEGHYGYLSKDDIWQMLSGKKISSIAEAIQIYADGVSILSPQIGLLTGAGNIKDFQGLKGELVWVGKATGPLTEDEAAKVKGKIALVDRGDVLFGVKFKNVSDAGALGVVLANNTTFLGRPYRADIGEPKSTLPGVMISTDDGKKLKENLAQGKKLEVEFLYQE